MKKAIHWQGAWVAELSPGTHPYPSGLTTRWEPGQPVTISYCGETLTMPAMDWDSFCHYQSHLSHSVGNDPTISLTQALQAMQETA